MRLCELLTTPSRHYKRLDKFLRALEKNINVVTTVTEYGERVTGVDEYFEDDDDRPRGIEQSFFVKVFFRNYSMVSIDIRKIVFLPIKILVIYGAFHAKSHTLSYLGPF